MFRAEAGSATQIQQVRKPDPQLPFEVRIVAVNPHFSHRPREAAGMPAMRQVNRGKPKIDVHLRNVYCAEWVAARPIPPKLIENAREQTPARRAPPGSGASSSCEALVEPLSNSTGGKRRG
jgi:hypothetical protein